MKTIMKENETMSMRKYPCLGRFKNKDRDYIVLFSEERIGMIVHVNYMDHNAYPIPGYYTSCWAESEFTIFTGEITLKNA